MADKVEPFERDELRDTVIRVEATATHIAESVDKLAGVVDRHVVKTGEQVGALHTKIDSQRDRVDEKYVTKERHDSEIRSLRNIVKSMGGAMIALAVAAVNYVIFGKG